MTLKKLSQICPGNKHFCQNSIRTIESVTSGAFYYNDYVKEQIRKENAAYEMFWICFNKAQTEKEKINCGTEYYYFDDYSEQYKYNLTSPINENLDILIAKSVFDKY